MALLGSTSLYYTLYLGSTWLYLTLLHSTMALLSSAGLYLTLLYTLPWLYVALLDSVQGRIQVGGGQGGPMPPMPPLSGLSRRKTRRFATRLAHVVATLTQRTSPYESLLHACIHRALKSAAPKLKRQFWQCLKHKG